MDQSCCISQFPDIALQQQSCCISQWIIWCHCALTDIAIYFACVCVCVFVIVLMIVLNNMHLPEDTQRQSMQFKANYQRRLIHIVMELYY